MPAQHSPPVIDEQWRYSGKLADADTLQLLNWRAQRDGFNRTLADRLFEPGDRPYLDTEDEQVHLCMYVMLHEHAYGEQAVPHCRTVWLVRLTDGSMEHVVLDVSLSDYRDLEDGDAEIMEQHLGRPGDVVAGELRTISLDELRPPPFGEERA